MFSSAQLRALTYKSMDALHKSRSDRNALRAVYYVVRHMAHHLARSPWGHAYRGHLERIDKGLTQGLSAEEAARVEDKLNELTKRLVATFNGRINVHWLREDEEAIVIDTVMKALREAMNIDQKLDEAQEADEPDADVNALFQDLMANYDQERRARTVFNHRQVAALTNACVARLGRSSRRSRRRYRYRWARRRQYYLTHAVRGLVAQVGYQLGRTPAGGWYRRAIADAAAGLVKAPIEHAIRQHERLQHAKKRMVYWLNRRLNVRYLDERQERVVIEHCINSIGSALAYDKILEATDFKEISTLKQQIAEQQSELGRHQQAQQRTQSAISETQAEIAELEARLSNLMNRAPEMEDHTLQVQENAANGTVIGHMSAHDVDRDDPVTFSITAGNDNGAFAIDAETGAVSVADASQIDYETAAAHSLTVKASDSGGKSDTATLTVNVSDAGPVFTDEIDEIDLNQPRGGMLVAQLAASDAAGSDLSFSITGGNDSGLFSVDAASGAIQLTDAVDFGQDHSLAVAVTDPSGETASRTLPIKFTFDDA